jgi:hypothetical protein
MNLPRLCTLLAVALFATATAANAAVHTVFPGDSIQDAIDGASPGDTILVEPGIYEETGNTTYGLEIREDNLRLIGKVDEDLGEAGKVILLKTGDQETGVYAAPSGPGDCEYRDEEAECQGVLHDFYIRGFTVKGFPQNGIQTRWVDGFKFIRNESVENLNNGIYPTLSANGLVQNNVSYGSLDTAMWVAGSENVRVIGNEMFDSVIGFEITVSNNVWTTHNDIHDNVVGVGLFHPKAAGNPPKPVMANWVIENNHIYNNNLFPNPAPEGSFQAGVPPGVGVLLLGVDNHVIGKNRIEGNGFVGIGVLGWCTATSFGEESRNCEPGNDPPVEEDLEDPAANNNLVYLNKLSNNGFFDPSPIPDLPPSDIIYLHLADLVPPFAAIEPPGEGNCFIKNKPAGEFTFFSSEPDGELPTDGNCKFNKGGGGCGIGFELSLLLPLLMGLRGRRRSLRS